MPDALCVFCDIIAGRLPGTIRYEDDEIVVFDNHLDWVPVMLLLAPRRHMTQTELWGSGGLIARMASLAVRMGQEHSPGGFRVLCRTSVRTPSRRSATATFTCWAAPTWAYTWCRRRDRRRAPQTRVFAGRLGHVLELGSKLDV